MKVVVIGGTSLIGSKLVSKALAARNDPPEMVTDPQPRATA
jgi:uncharacterized protein YbjT (DUF2867 family)